MYTPNGYHPMEILPKPEVVTWRLVGYYYCAPASDGRNTSGTCEACGHGIREVFVIQSSQNTRMNVGSECVKQWVGSDDHKAEELVKRTQRRVTRAKRQWREEKPPRRPSETREDYIHRRIIEMQNALNASRAWHSGRGWGWSAAQIAEFEEKYKANSFDYARTMWDVRKI